MDKVEALKIATAELAEFKAKNYEELRNIIDFSASKEHEQKNGKYYQTQIQIFWDDSKEKKDIRVHCAVDDGGWRTFFPIVKTFIISPSGEIDE